jgi:hypothetical protein
MQGPHLVSSSLTSTQVFQVPVPPHWRLSPLWQRQPSVSVGPYSQLGAVAAPDVGGVRHLAMLQTCLLTMHPPSVQAPGPPPPPAEPGIGGSGSGLEGGGVVAGFTEGQGTAGAGGGQSLHFLLQAPVKAPTSAAAKKLNRILFMGDPQGAVVESRAQRKPASGHTL